LCVLTPATNIPVASFGDMRFIPAVALESLGVKLPFTIPGDVDILEPTSGGDHDVVPLW
jgi:hypothetical protein